MKMLDLKPSEQNLSACFFLWKIRPTADRVFLIMLILSKKTPLKNESRKNETSILLKDILQKAVRQSFNLVFYWFRQQCLMIVNTI